MLHHNFHYYSLQQSMRQEIEEAPLSRGSPCVYVCCISYVYIYIHTHLHILPIYMYMYIYIYICIYIHICINAHIFNVGFIYAARTYTPAHTYIHTHTHICIHWIHLPTDIQPHKHTCIHRFQTKPSTFRSKILSPPYGSIPSTPNPEHPLNLETLYSKTVKP